MASAPALPEHDQAAPPLAGWTDGLHLLPSAQAGRAAFIDAWDDLVWRACEPNPFFEPWFLKPSLAHLATNQRVEIAALIEAGHLRGLLPISRPLTYYGYPLPHCTTWLHDNAFCGTPLIADGYEWDFWRALFDALDTDPRQALFLHLPQLAAKGPASDALRAVLTHQERPNYVSLSEERAMLSSGLSSTKYLEQSMSSKKRKELRRQHKRLADDGQITIERLEGDNGIVDWVDEFCSVERAGWKGAEGSALASTSETQAFFMDTLLGAAHAGRLERLALRVEGRPIAMLANFLTAPGAYSFKTAFDERYAKHSPGMLLQLENLELLDREEIEWCDSCAIEGHSMIERLWREKRAITALNIAIGGGLRRKMFQQLMRRETRQRTAG